MVGITSRGIKRGDVYYIRYDRSVGAEEAVGRPCVVVSADSGNENSTLINALYMTTALKYGGVNVPVTSTSRKSWVLCNQIYTFDRVRLGDFMCTLTEEEMSAIDAALGTVLGLSLEDPTAEQRHRETLSKHEAELAALKEAHEKELAAVRSEVVGQLVDFELHKRLYDRAMDELVALKFGKDLVAKESVEEAAEEAAEEAQETQEGPEIPEEDALVDINRCSLGALVGLGFSVATAKMIMAALPYLSVDDLRGVPGVTRVGYLLVEKKITVGDTAEFKPKPKAKRQKPVKAEEPVKVADDGKVNVNTATYQELRDKAGLNETTAKNVVAYRRKHGDYATLEELLNVNRFGKTCLKKFRDRLTVDGKE